MEKLYDWIEQIIGLPPSLQSKIYTSILIILILWIIRLITLHAVWRKTESPQLRYRWQKSSTYIIVSIGIVIIGRVWFTGIQSLATYLGLLSAGVAIALKDLIVSIAGWMFIIWRKPFTVGDRIQISTYSGDVIDQRLFKFSLLEIGNWVDADQSTGRIMHLPNSMALTEVVSNYSKGFQFIWNEIPVLVTFESNWKKAKSILQKIATLHAEELSTSAEKKIKEASKKFMIFYTTLTPTVYTSVKDCGVLLTIRYLIEPRRRRVSEQGIWEDILIAFAKEKDIDFAYPTQRFYNNFLEGKEETKPKMNKD
jgi:small-conductance mechanosensitive channel